MSQLTVIQLNDREYQITGEQIDSKIWYIDQWTNKVTGKGSQKFKELILSTIHEYIKNKEKEYRQNLENKIAAERQKLFSSNKFKNIELLKLYKADLHYYDGYYNDFIKSTSYKTGYEITQSNKVINFTDYNINNTDIYSIGHKSDLERKALIDNRIFIIAYHGYVTGLTLKEMLHNGLQTYENIRLVEDAELYTIQQYGQSGATSFAIFDTTPTSDKMNMKDRYNNEMIRAYNNHFQAPKTRYTSDNKPIQKAWFMSKPCQFSDIEKMEMATYDNYIIDNTITISKATFDQFKESFSMDLLPIEFTGGTSSIYEGLSDKESFYDNSIEEQQKWIEGVYNIVLKVVCDDYDYSLLVDPQGYNYARYVALINN